MMDEYEKIGSLVGKIRKRPRKELQKAALKILENDPLFDIEASSACNINCSFCPRTKLKRKQAIMSSEIFTDVLNFLPQNAIVMFAGFGEPLLNKNLEIYIRQLKDRNISSCIITNGILLTSERQKRIIDAGIDQIQVSYSAATNDGFAKIIGDIKYKSIVDNNLNYLAKNRSKGLRVQLNFVLSKENSEELFLVRNFANSLGFGTYVRRVHSRGGNYTKSRDNNIMSSCGIYAAVTPITAEGKILACSNDLEEDSCLGMVSDLSWHDVLSWKKENLFNDLGFKPCCKCNDDYRWIILDNLSVDSK